MSQHRSGARVACPPLSAADSMRDPQGTRPSIYTSFGSLRRKCWMRPRCRQRRSMPTCCIRSTVRTPFLRDFAW